MTATPAWTASAAVRRPALERAAYLRDVVRELVVRDLHLRYKRSVLGIGWSLLNPLLQLLVFYFVFRVILPVAVKDFAIFLFAGILVWNWWSSALQSGCTAITDNVSLIRQPGFPGGILPVATVAAHMVNFLLAFPILVAAVVAQGHHLTLSVAALPALVAVQFLMTLSFVYLFATIHVPFRDTQYLVGIALLLGFYLSPVFYSAEAIPPAYRAIYRLNPMVHLLEGYRAVLMHGEWPRLLPLAVITLVSAAVLAVSYSIFQRASRWFVEEIGG